MFRIPDNIDSKFRFITIAAMRAKQLQRGARPRVESRATKPTAIAREEVLGGLIEFEVGAEEAEAPAADGEVTHILEG